MDAFLRDKNLLPLPAPYPPPPAPDVPPPAGLSDRGLQGFHAYLLAGPHKAFATDGQGYFGFSTAQINQQLADEHAVENCKKAPGTTPCQVVMRGNDAVAK